METGFYFSQWLIMKHLLIILSLFLLISTVFAETIIDSSSFQNKVFVQGGELQKFWKGFQVASKWQESVLLLNSGINEDFNKISFKDTDYHFQSVILIWKIKWQNFDQKSNQMALPISDWSVFLPESINFAGFDFVWVVFLTPQVRFESISFSKKWFFDNWNQFIEPNLVKPSSINLLYAWKWWDTSFIAIVGVLSIIIFLSLYWIDERWAFGSLLVLWILLDLRYIYDQVKILQTTQENFVSKNGAQQKYFDFDNFYWFIEASKQYIQWDVNIYAPQEWPFHINYAYGMLPKNVKWQWTEFPYFAVFHLPTKLVDWNLYIEKNLVWEKIKLIYQFDTDSYIFKKQ